MNRKKALKILDVYGRPSVSVGKATLTFARQQEDDIAEIEALNSGDLVDSWKSLVWINHIYGQVSLNELQRIDLLELEMYDRKDINEEEIREWYKTEEANFVDPEY